MAAKTPPAGKPGAVGAGLLDRILAPENLAAAWEAVAANAGIPGVDGERIGRFRRNWEARLVALADDVRNNHYRPAPLRSILIPKRSGGQRQIGIPTLNDRVLQRPLQALLPRLDRVPFVLLRLPPPPRVRLSPPGPTTVTAGWLLEAGIDVLRRPRPHHPGRPVEREIQARGPRPDGRLAAVGRPPPNEPRASHRACPSRRCGPTSTARDGLAARPQPLVTVRYADDFIVAPSADTAAQPHRRRRRSHACCGSNLPRPASLRSEGFDSSACASKMTPTRSSGRKGVTVEGEFAIVGQYMQYDY